VAAHASAGPTIFIILVSAAITFAPRGVWRRCWTCAGEPFANPLQVRAIAHAKVKTDKIDALTLAKLHAAGFLPEVWQPDETTERLRRQVAQRAIIVRGRTRLKNRIHAVLSRNLLPLRKGDLFSGPGRVWLANQPLETDERHAVSRWLEELDRLGIELERVDQILAQAALGDECVRRLMTVAGINLTIAIGLIAACRASQARRNWSAASGSIRGSGNRAMAMPTMGASRRSGELMLEPCWSRPRGLPRRKRGKPIAAVATARKMTVIIWHLLRAGPEVS
jgi:transposase